MTSYETIIKLIGSTKTKRGLRVEARLDEREYETGKKISDDEIFVLDCNLIACTTYLYIDRIYLLSGSEWI